MFNRLREIRSGMKTIVALGTGAERFAAERGDEKVDAEHLLLACLALPDGSARRALQRIDLDPDALGAAIKACHQQPLADIGVDPDYLDDIDSKAAAHNVPNRFADYTPAGRAVMQELAARRAQHRPLQAAHVLDVINDRSYGVASRALSHVGVQADVLRAAIAQEL